MRGYLLLLIAQVELKDFLLPKANSKSEIKEAISSGLSPPCILYKVFYSIPAEQQVKPAELTVALHGEDLELRFNCRIMEGMCECICWCACVCVCVCVCVQVCICMIACACA